MQISTVGSRFGSRFTLSGELGFQLVYAVGNLYRSLVSPSGPHRLPTAMRRVAPPPRLCGRPARRHRRGGDGRAAGDGDLQAYRDPVRRCGRLLAGTSVVLGSHTGSGKTLAYLLPLYRYAWIGTHIHSYFRYIYIIWYVGPRRIFQWH